jgi:hypothetical protein
MAIVRPVGIVHHLSVLPVSIRISAMMGLIASPGLYIITQSVIIAIKARETSVTPPVQSLCTCGLSREAFRILRRAPFPSSLEAFIDSIVREKTARGGRF